MGPVGRVVGLVVLVTCRAAVAAEAAPQAPVQFAQEIGGRPVLIDRDALWPGVVIICILGLFVMAALVGPLVRANQFDDAASEDQKEY